jgi:predicted ester cyclase
VTSPEDNKALVRALVELVNRRDLDALDQVTGGEIARAARGWIGPFTESFPDFHMEVADLIAEGDKVVAHLKCSGTWANGVGACRPVAASRGSTRSTSSGSRTAG